MWTARFRVPQDQRLPRQMTLLILVKYWSNTGQTLVKTWAILLPAGPMPSASNDLIDTGQILVKYWSNTGLKLGLFFFPQDQRLLHHLHHRGHL